MNEQREMNKNVSKLLKKNDVSEIVNKIINNNEKLSIIYDIFSVTYALCENIREKNFEVYKNSVEPEMIRLDFVKKKLNDPNLTKEQEEEWLFELVTIGRSINNKGEKYNKSNIDRLAHLLGGAALGALSIEVIRRIFTKK